MSRSFHPYLSALIALTLVACHTAPESSAPPVSPPTVQPEKIDPVEPTAPEPTPITSEVLPEGYQAMPNMPDLETLQKLNAQYHDHVVKVSLDGLSEKDLQFLHHMVLAADVMDELFWLQSSPYGLEWRAFYDNWTEPLNEWDTNFRRLLMINYGTSNRLKDFAPFASNVEVPRGANYYPGDVTKDEVTAIIEAKKDPVVRAQFEDVYTILRYDNDQLVPIPYSLAYKAQLAIAARHLRDAAKYADSPSLIKFLLSRAEAFETNQYQESDADWVRVEGSKFDVTIGPYEVYEDRLLGMKGAFEAFICINDKELSDELSKIKAYLAKMDAAIPLDEKYRGYKRSSGSPIFAVDVVLTTGDTNAGIKTSAFNLPNDEDVREKVGSKKVLLRSHMEGKFHNSLLPISKIILVPEQRGFVDWISYFSHALLHELMHGIGPGKITVDGEKTTVGKTLKELYPAIEELKADTLGFWAVNFLISEGFYSPDRQQTAAVTSLAGIFRGVRFGIEEAHGKSAMMMYNYLAEHGAFVYDAETDYYSVIHEKYQPALIKLAREILVIEATGNYAAAKAFIDKYGHMPDYMKATLVKLKDIPVDIRTIYKTADTLRQM